MKDNITIIALFVGPMLAILTQLWFERRKENRRQKLWAFTTLMANRKTVVSVDFAKALNIVSVIFYKNKAVRRRLKELLLHLYSSEWKEIPISPQTLEKSRDLLAQLLGEMALDLGYEYDHTELKDDAYYPQTLADNETEAKLLRGGMLAVVGGEKSISVTVKEPQAHFSELLPPIKR